MTTLRPAALAFVLAASLAACGYLPEVAMPGTGTSGGRAMLVDRVWLDESPQAPKGSLLVFLSDGTLVIDSCGETWRLAPWRWVEDLRLVWEEDATIVRAEVAAVGRDSLALSLELPGGETLGRKFRAAQAPIVCPGD